MAGPASHRGGSLHLAAGHVQHTLSFIADELTLTRAQEQATAKEEANLREAEEQVMLASKTVEVETKKLVAAKSAEGDRTAETTRAETVKLVAAIEKETAALELLRQALDAGHTFGEDPDSLYQDPFLESVREDPEFKAFVAEAKRRVGQTNPE